MGMFFWKPECLHGNHDPCLACRQGIWQRSFRRDFCYKAVDASSLLCFIACLFLLVRLILGQMLPKFTHDLAWVSSYLFSQINQT